MDKGKKTKSFKGKIFLMIVFVLGFLIASYPFISQWYYRIEADNQIQEFISSVKELDKAEIEERLKLARAYNKTLDPSRLADPYSEIEKKGIATYAKMLEVHEKIGYVEVPKIDLSLPIYAGTAEEVLQKAAGHLEGTSLPIGGESSHSVITAHRGLPSAKLFTDLDRLKKGDKFYIHMLDQVLAYKVDQVLTVEPSNFEPVLVVKGKDYSTLLTCTPYSINSHRLLVRGERIPYVAPIKEKEIAEVRIENKYRTLLYIAIIILFILLYILYKTARRPKRLNDNKKHKTPNY